MSFFLLLVILYDKYVCVCVRDVFIIQKVDNIDL